MGLGDGDTETCLQLSDYPPGSSISGGLSIGAVPSGRERTTATDSGSLPSHPRGNRSEIARNSYILLDTIVMQHTDGVLKAGANNWRPPLIHTATGHPALQLIDQIHSGTTFSLLQGLTPSISNYPVNNSLQKNT